MLSLHDRKRETSIFLFLLDRIREILCHIWFQSALSKSSDMYERPVVDKISSQWSSFFPLHRWSTE